MKKKILKKEVLSRVPKRCNCLLLLRPQLLLFLVGVKKLRDNRRVLIKLCL